MSDRSVDGDTVASPGPDLWNDAAVAGRPLALVVEDDVDSRTICSLALTRAGFHVVSVEDAGQAEWALSSAPPSLALVLLDLHLPDRSGLDILRSLRDDERHGGVPVIVATADTDLGYSEEVRLQASEVMIKPFNFPALITLVKRVGSEERR